MFVRVACGILAVIFGLVGTGGVIAVFKASNPLDAAFAFGTVIALFAGARWSWRRATRAANTTGG